MGAKNAAPPPRPIIPATDCVAFEIAPKPPVYPKDNIEAKGSNAEANPRDGTFCAIAAPAAEEARLTPVDIATVTKTSVANLVSIIVFTSVIVIVDIDIANSTATALPIALNLRESSFSETPVMFRTPKATSGEQTASALPLESRVYVSPSALKPFP